MYLCMTLLIIVCGCSIRCTLSMVLHNSQNTSLKQFAWNCNCRAHLCQLSASPSLVDNPYVVVYNKMDFPEAYERWNVFREKLKAEGNEPYCISAIKT